MPLPALGLLSLALSALPSVHSPGPHEICAYPAGGENEVSVKVNSEAVCVSHCQSLSRSGSPHGGMRLGIPDHGAREQQSNHRDRTQDRWRHESV